MLCGGEWTHVEPPSLPPSPKEDRQIPSLSNAHLCVCCSPHARVRGCLRRCLCDGALKYGQGRCGAHPRHFVFFFQLTGFTLPFSLSLSPPLSPSICGHYVKPRLGLRAAKGAAAAHAHLPSPSSCSRSQALFIFLLLNLLS